MTELPTVTITIPVLNEATYIGSVLDAVLAQDYPQDKLEVILADGMSTDGTQEIIQRYVRQQAEANGWRTGPYLTVINNPGRIVSTGLNTAIREARGDVIVRVDAHTIIEQDYVRQCVAALEQSGADGVGGPMMAVGAGYTAEAIALASSSPFGIGNSVYRTSRYFRERFVETTHMGAYRKGTLFKVGLFNEHFVRHQDYELDYRIRQGGGSIFLSPYIRSHYFVRGSLQKLWRQYFQYGFWKGKFLRESASSLKWRHAVPPLFVLALAATIILALAGSPLGLPSLFMTGALYLLFLLLGTAATCAKKECLKYLPITPIIFVCLHLSWGLGVWFGLFLPELLSPKRWPR
ncbi:MAG: glycosyltransferase family 2 protein [Chloroflexi bacterium]|nr:glycosyltransferase family 2 protein [Chloroflexota bacterium]MCI0579651.1 glycosyltransferase family 2 protein [Chloroflexota bacterium]MCI0645909.1 glycosyltransferase family 2 protein [Chloroflexota bacterium]MCI0725764.1 glycosyltransferase family 2 protein [Chloroflexota bacterium]